MTNFDQGYRLDLVAVDKEEQTILIGGVRAHPVAESDATEELTTNLRALREPPPFALFVDPAQIRLFRWDGNSLSEPVYTLATIDVLRYYDPDLGQRRVFEAYLTTLVESWLRDLAYHWKSERPPATDELSEVGLLKLLEGGGTLSNVEMCGGHLHRD